MGKVLCAAGAGNYNGNSDDNGDGNIVFTIKVICSCLNFIRDRQSKLIKTSK